MKIKYIYSSIALIVLLLIVDLVWIIFSPVYISIGVFGTGLPAMFIGLTYIIGQTISYVVVFDLWLFIFLVEFIIYKTKLLKQREINIKDKRLLIFLGTILISPVVIFMTLAIAPLFIKGMIETLPSISDKFIQYEQNLPKNEIFYKEVSNSKHNKYNSIEVSVQATPKETERSEHLTTNENYCYSKGFCKPKEGFQQNKNQSDNHTIKSIIEKMKKLQTN